MMLKYGKLLQNVMTPDEASLIFGKTSSAITICEDWLIEIHYQSFLSRIANDRSI